MSTISEKILEKMNEKYQKALQIEDELNKNQIQLSSLQNRIIEREASIDEEVNQKCLVGVSREEAKKLIDRAEEEKKSVRQKYAEQKSEIKKKIKRLENQLDELDEEEMERRRLAKVEAKVKEGKKLEEILRRRRETDQRLYDNQKFRDNWDADHRGN